jgi:serine/threonine protein kinase
MRPPEDSPPSDSSGATTTAADASRGFTTDTPYRLIQPLGSGGMGEVWLAERVDGLINRPVALKLPHLATARAPGLAERMAREREILASLDHRNIARLLDAGLTADGQPFLALEYVEGLGIDVYCAGAQGSAPLDVPARLRLFRQVIDAVAYAHGKLVIHRDLKPANILVTPGGGVKLLDFGVAKLLENGQSRDSHLTEISGQAMTPQYASPEQILGKPLTVASDVYSLGVVLFELLTGERPYKPVRSSRGALEEAIVRSDPPRPSEVTTDRLRKWLRGDLDTILLKALKKEPRERYSTANAFAEDLTRYLEHRPVQAQPDSARYVVSKFVARNRLAVGAGTGTFIAVIATAAIAVWQMMEAREQRDRARRMHERAVATNEFLDTLIEERGADGKPLSLTESLDRSVAILERNYEKKEATNAALLYEASRRYAAMGKEDREMQLLEKVTASARKLGDIDLLAAAQCSAAHGRISADRAAAAAHLAQVDAALTGGRRLSPGAAWICVRPRAAMREADGDTPGAIALLTRALQEDLAGDADERMPLQVRTALLNDRGSLQYKSDDVAGSLASIAESIALIEAAGRDVSMNMVIMRMNHAAILTRAGEVADALQEQQRAVTLSTQFDVSGEPPVGFASHLANSHLQMGNYAEAVRLTQSDVTRAAAVGNARQGALSEMIAARALIKLGREAEALQALARAEEVLRGNPQGNARLLNEATLTRVDLMRSRGELAQARKTIDELLARAQYPSKKTTPGLGSLLYSAAKIALAQGDAASAERFATDAVPLAAKSARDASRSATVGQAVLNRAEALAALGRRDEAAREARTAELALAAGFSADHPDTLRARELAASLAGSSPRG